VGDREREGGREKMRQDREGGREKRREEEEIQTVREKGREWERDRAN